ncbi:AAA+ ATPase domain-containing protein [Cynara cardunculus var. scolymus]|uniref:ABC-type xenobiotic transporter n=1 Tax=Cynara cardunculus var. scolymus TaxID=59895 RepID=A0A103Y7A9_CYNCS|nr:AAA+ ATPase domain-containing protein [Cynara cardunculus var. scolymus]
MIPMIMGMKLMGSDKALRVLELTATGFNLTLMVLSVLIVFGRKIAVYVRRNRVRKEDADEVGSRVSLISDNGRVGAAVEAEFLNVEIGKAYKASVYCCFYVLLLQTVVLCYDSVCLITKSAQWEKGVNWEPLLLPGAQFLAWFLLTFSTLNCKAKTLERFPLLMRVWWVTSFIISLCTLYLDGKEFAIEGSKHLNSHLLANLAATPALGFLCFVALRGVTGIRVIGSDLQEPLLVEEDAGCLKVTPYSEAGLFSLATLSWLNSLLSIGVKRPLELRDIPLLAPEDRSKFNYKILNSNWERLKAESVENQPSLAWALLKSFWKEAAKNAIFAGLYTLVSYVGPYMITDFVDFLSGIERFPHEGYVLAGVFFVAKLIETLTTRQWYLGVDILGMHVRSALTAMVYRKGLRLSSSARQSHTSGEIVNYMAVDVQRVGDYAWYLHDIWMLPMQIILALAILYKSVGIACIATLIATILSIVITIPLARVQELYQDKLMAAKDDRMRKTSECLRNMRILKSQAWEDRYKVRLEEMRSVEFKWLKKALYSQAFITFFFWSSPIFVAAVTFGTSILIGGQLTAGGVLSALATFRILQEPLRNFPDLVSMMAQTKVSLDRITGFLQEEELQEDATIVLQRGMSNMAIEIKDGEFQWDASAPRPTLSGIQMKVVRGMRVRICGSAAYVSQSAWIQSGNIEENVLFGNAMDKAKYKRVLHACSLKKDLELFSHGDQTIIGDRGINLSGGQKQRVQLARALYQDADIYLLDDPFSAVDAHTGSELFKEYILTALAAKTVVFVTHQVEFLPAADLILVLKEGQIIQAGKYDELLQAGTDFNTLVSAHQEAIEAMDIYNHSDDESDGHHPLDGSITNCESVGTSMDAMAKVPNENASISDHKAIKEKKKAKRSRKKQLVQEEERERGKISMKIYLSYMAAAYKGLLIPLIIIAQILFQGLQIASNWWMAWANPQTEGDTARVSNLVLIAVYMALAFGSSWFIFVRAVLVATFGLAAAQKLFLKMLINVFRAPMSFFDSTPAGRILNRVSVDQSVVDLDIPFRLGGFASTTIQLLGIVGVMTQKYYMASSRELVRIVSIQKSPIINLFGESIAGAATIRGFGQEKRFMKRNLYLLDCFARPFFCSIAAIEWLCLRMELISTFVFAFCLVRYKENLPVVLRGVTCEFPGGKKIGIVGRTGSGKSTLIQALFRLIEPESGRIIIDNIDISSIGLHDLRGRLSIIPQDPTLFEGTIRGNLDPLEEHSDQEIWEALDKSQLGDTVREKEQKLDAPVLENGDNWSVGQRQLVSLGRALLKQARILVLDEATASVDSATDNLIQKIIRQEFKDWQVAEFDSPIRLLEDKSSMFYKLVTEYSSRSSGIPDF